MLRTLAVVAVAMLALATSAAQGAVIQERGGLASATNGIVLGPDGNFWAAEYVNGTVVRLSPTGQILGRVSIGSRPISLATGPGGRVWVTTDNAVKLVWIDATSPAPAAHDVSVAAVTDCGTVAIADGGNGRMYFSMPQSSDCSASHRVGSIAADATGTPNARTGVGPVFDLEVSAGKLYAPDFDGNVVRRLALDSLAIETAVAIPGGGNPDGIAADSTGTVWTTLYGAGAVARFPGSQNGGSATRLNPTGGVLTKPFGIVAGPGGMYVAGSESANIARIGAGDSWSFYPVGSGQPFQATRGPDDEVWFSDLVGSRVLRLVNAPPRPTTGDATVLAPTAATLAGKVDPRGNQTQVFFDYGTSDAYGQTAGPIDVAQGAGAVDAQASLQGLRPGTTYHYRLRAVNAEGTAAGADRSFTTQPAPPPPTDQDGDNVSPPDDCDDTNPAIKPGAVDVPGDGINQDCRDGDEPFPRLTSIPSLTGTATRRVTRIRKLRVPDLTGGERIELRCATKRRGCPYAKRTVTAKKAGTLNVADRRLRRARFRPGARLVVSVTKPNTVGRRLEIIVRRGAPKLVRRCLPPGGKPVAC